MTEPGPTYGTMTPERLSPCPSVVPDNQILSNECVLSPWTIGNGETSPMTHSSRFKTSLDVYNASGQPPLNTNTPNGSKNQLMESDALAHRVTTSTGTNKPSVKAIEATLRAFPKTLILEKQSPKSQRITPLRILGMPVEYFHTTDFCLEGEHRMKRQLYVGFMDPRVPEKARRLMNSRMTSNKENVPITNPQNTSGGMDTTEFPM